MKTIASLTSTDEKKVVLAETKAKRIVNSFVRIVPEPQTSMALACFNASSTVGQLQPPDGHYVLIWYSVAQSGERQSSPWD